MRRLDLRKAFTLIEPGPVVLVTMVVDFSPHFAMTTGRGTIPTPR